MITKIIKYGREIATGEVKDLELEAKGLVTLIYHHVSKFHDAFRNRDAKESKIQLKLIKQTSSMFIGTVEKDITDYRDRIEIYRYAQMVCMRILWDERNTYRENKKIIKTIHRYYYRMEYRIMALDLLANQKEFEEIRQQIFENMVFLVQTAPDVLDRYFELWDAIVKGVKDE